MTNIQDSLDGDEPDNDSRIDVPPTRSEILAAASRIVAAFVESGASLSDYLIQDEQGQYIKAQLAADVIFAALSITAKEFRIR